MFIGINSKCTGNIVIDNGKSILCDLKNEKDILNHFSSYFFFFFITFFL